MDKEIIVYYDQDAIDPVRGRRSSTRKGKAIDYGVLKSNITEFYSDLIGIVEGLNDAPPKFQLNEIEISAEIGVNGEIGFMGTGVGGNAKASITFKIRRN